MLYPYVLSEEETIHDAQRSRDSLARFGDGELNLARGRASVSQKWSPEIQTELRAILREPQPGLLVCIPNIGRPGTPRARFWQPFTTEYFTGLYGSQLYGSSFISRPDNAPWIDRPDYWESVRALWRSGPRPYVVAGQFTLSDVVGQDVSGFGYSVAPIRDAYSAIDHLEDEVTRWQPRGAVVIALGAAGTCLAARLARKGIWALDLGHIGQFMKNPGAFAFEPAQLATDAYREQLREAHATTNWGRGGASWAEPIAAFAKAMEAADVLDYGAGGRTLAPALAVLGVKCREYDPGVVGIDILPKLADVVASTDVFEHIEPELVPNVLAHTFALARKGAFFVIAKQPAKKILPDGRNAHLSCHETSWWVDKLRAAGWQDIKVVTDEWKKCVLKLRK